MQIYLEVFPLTAGKFELKLRIVYCGKVYFQNHQGDDNGDHGITEIFDTVGFYFYFFPGHLMAKYSGSWGE